MLQLSVFPSFLHEWPSVQISVKSPVCPTHLTRYSCATAKDQSTKPTTSIYFSITQLFVYKTSFFFLNFPTEQALAISFSAAKINPLGSRLLLYCLPICLCVWAKMWPSASPRALWDSDSWPKPSQLLSGCLELSTATGEGSSNVFPLFIHIFLQVHHSVGRSALINAEVSV